MPSSSGPAPNLKPGDECEVQVDGKSDEEPSSWHPANVKMIKGEFFVVDLKSDNKSEIVPSDKIRSPNKK